MSSFIDAYVWAAATVHATGPEVFSGTPRFVVFSSYGNDSVALIQWAHENGLERVEVVYTDTGWADPGWAARIDHLERWVHGLGYRASRIHSEGFVNLARRKKGFPTQRFQWCSYILKIEPAMRWLDEEDPARAAVCLVGVRREESNERAAFPGFLAKSGNHGGRVMLAPLAEYSEEDRDALLARAGVEPLPHKSRECHPCINSNKADLRSLPEPRIREIETLEDEMGFTKKGKPRTLFRPHRHMGAVGIREVVRWANSPRGKFKPTDPEAAEPPDDLPDENFGGCDTGWCGT